MRLNNRLNFFDVNVNTAEVTLNSATFTKSCNQGIYLKPRGECQQRYREGTVKNLIHHTFKSWTGLVPFLSSVEKLKKTFIKNGSSNGPFDAILQKKLSAYLINKLAKVSFALNLTNVRRYVYYENRFSITYNFDEWMIMFIVYTTRVVSI